MKFSDLILRYDGVLRILCRAGFAVSVLLVVVLSLLPQDIAPVFKLSDKIVHFFAYAAMALLGLLGFQGAAGRVGVGVILLGGVLEVAQAYIPGRSADLLDFAVNTAGVAAACLLTRLLRPLWSHGRGSTSDGLSGS